MPRPINALAETLLDRTANLWAQALSEGSITIRLHSKRALINTRNKLYAYRAEQRRFSQSHTGFKSSCYDPLNVTYREELDPSLAPTGFWLLRIGRGDFIEFELLSASIPGAETSPNGATMPDQPEVVDDSAPTQQPEAPDGQEVQVQESEVQEGQGDIGDDADPS